MLQMLRGRHAAGSKVAWHLHDGGNLSEALHIAGSDKVSGVNTSGSSPYATKCGRGLHLELCSLLPSSSINKPIRISQFRFNDQKKRWDFFSFFQRAESQFCNKRHLVWVELLNTFSVNGWFILHREMRRPPPVLTSQERTAVDWDVLHCAPAVNWLPPPGNLLYVLFCFLGERSWRETKE